MARVGRLAGAILVETASRYFLVGDLKEPCDFGRAGFQNPGAIEPLVRPYIELTPLRPITLAAPYLTLRTEGATLAELLARRLLIERNGSVSERLWRLVCRGGADQDDLPPHGPAVVDANWLGEIPPGVWQVVRDAVLRCT